MDDENHLQIKGPPCGKWSVGSQSRKCNCGWVRNSQKGDFVCEKVRGGKWVGRMGMKNKSE